MNKDFSLSIKVFKGGVKFHNSNPFCSFLRILKGL